MKHFFADWWATGSPLLRGAGALLVLLLGGALSAQAQQFFQDDAAATRQAATKVRTANDLKHARYLTLNETGMRTALASAPLESSRSAAPLVLTLPLPDGTTQHFRVVESSIMAPALAAQFPQLKTYTGVGIDNPDATIRLDLTPLGFHAQVLTNTGKTFYIEPTTRTNATQYLSFFRQDLPVSKQGCGVSASTRQKLGGPAHRTATPQSVGAQLRTYRLAVAANGEFTAEFGGTVAGGMAAVVSTVNAVVGEYERELAVRLVLVPNNNLLIYTNAATDPYDNTNQLSMLDANQANLDAVIGNANYDIGHVFAVDNGGVAVRGVCDEFDKGKGVTGIYANSSPSSTVFVTDFVSHEMGHQFGAAHAFNSADPNCIGPRAGDTAYEPGSGTTTMCYAGVCGPDDVQSQNDFNFHVTSYEQIQDYIAATATCAVLTATGNTPPVPTLPAGGQVLPMGTPFKLTASGTDVNNDPLTYSWQQYDLGQAATRRAPQVANDNVPLFRSFSPTVSPTRYFPQLDSLVANIIPINERLPTVARALTFRMTLRDMHNGAAGTIGGITSSGLVSMSVTSAAGPFLVTAPNTAISWVGNSTQTVTWAVAGTTGNGVNCANVNIRLSTDGGFTYPTVLLANTPNDGTQAVVLPNTPTTTARVMVEAVGNYFFDISNSNFTITPAPDCAPPTALSVSSITTTTASVSFTASSTAASYTVTTSPATTTQTVTTSPVALTGLTPNTAYTVSFVSNCTSAATATSGTVSTTFTTSATAATASTWTGAISTDWFTAGNWTAGVPTIAIDATIPASAPRYPVVAAGTAVARALSLSGGGTLTQSGGTLDVRGSWTNNGTFTATGGVVSLGQTTAATILGSSNSRFWNLTAQTSGIVLGTSATTQVQRVLTLTGSLATQGNPLTLLSGSTGDALVVNSGGTVTGAATVQRYIDPSLNAGMGYRHYSAPVTNTTVGDLATSGFTPALTTAYNTSATPSQVTPFPTVFAYDQSRLATAANNYGAFDKGFVVPASTTTALTIGQGYDVQIGANQLVDFVGTLTTGTQTVSLARNAGVTAADAGWSLLGNPYPAPLDYSLVAATDRPNLDAAIYVFSSTSQYGGQYRSYINGFGNAILPVAQGFFVRVSAGQTSGSLTFKDADRLTAPTTTTFQRTAADPRPLVQLDLRSPSTGQADALSAYAEAGATAAFDNQYDALKLPNTTGLNLASLATDQASLAIDGRAAFTLTTSIPLAVGVPAAGSYTLSATSLANLPAGLTAYLRDAQTGQTTALSVGTSYPFSVTGAQAAALLVGRFTLQFSPQAPLATVAALAATDVSVYPNPAHSSFTVLMPGVANATSVQAELLNALGQVVRRQSASLPASGTTLLVPAAELAPGVYMLRLQAGVSTLVKRVVIQ